jgi:hypothetical protein
MIVKIPTTATVMETAWPITTSKRYLHEQRGKPLGDVWPTQCSADEYVRIYMKYLALPMMAISLGFASCAAPQKAAPSVVAGIAGASFDQVGKVSLYVGQPCTSQIMFLFRAGKSPAIPMAARARETKTLTDAARRHRPVHVSGKWRGGKATGCAYVEISQVEMQNWFSW